MPNKKNVPFLIKSLVGFALLLGLLIGMVSSKITSKAFSGPDSDRNEREQESLAPFDRQIHRNNERMLHQGRQTFRFDTFGDEAFWGDTLRLHEAVATVSPKTALSVGLAVWAGVRYRCPARGRFPEAEIPLFNLVLGLKLSKEEKADLVAFLRCL